MRFQRMLLVEDVLLVMNNLVNDRGFTFGFNSWHRSFLKNIGQHVVNGRQLSTEQSRIVLKLIENSRHHITANSQIKSSDIDELLAQPIYRQIPYVSTNIRKEVRHIGDNKLGFRCKYNEVIVKEFWSLATRANCPAAEFNNEHRIWIVEVTKSSRPFIKSIITEHRFEMDSHTSQWWNSTAKAIGGISTAYVNKDTDLIVMHVLDNPLLALWAVNVAGGSII